MSEIDEILNQVPMDQVAAALGVDQSEAEEATRTAIPALLGGMQANAADPAGAAAGVFLFSIFTHLMEVPLGAVGWLAWSLSPRVKGATGEDATDGVSALRAR